MAEIIDAERDSNNDDGVKPSRKRKRKMKSKAAQSDDEDNNFVVSTSESESEGSELDSIEITNEEVDSSHPYFILND